MAGDTDTTESLVGLFDPTTMPRRQQLGLLALVGLASLPLVVRDITVLKLTGAMFFAVYVMTWDVVSGYTGEISFGHALFVGVGGYTSGLLNVIHGWPLWATIPAGVVVATVAGALIGVPSLRLKGPYFSLVTLVAPLILLSFFRLYSGITGGETGRFGIATISIDPLVNYYIAFAVFLLALGVFLAVTRSDAGIVLTAIREDELAVEAGGLNPAKYKLFVFLLSGAVGGLAGAVFVHTFAQGVVNPTDLLGLVLSIEIIVAAILGGIGTITGAAIGGFFFFLVRDAIRNLSELVIPLPPFGSLVVELTVPFLNMPISDFDLLLFGLVTLFVLFVVPYGLVRWLIIVGRKLQARLSGGEPDAVADGGQTPLEQVIAKFRRQLRAVAGTRDPTRDHEHDRRGGDRQ